MNNQNDDMQQAGAQAASGCALIAFAIFVVPVLFGGALFVMGVIGAIFGG